MNRFESYKEMSPEEFHAKVILPIISCFKCPLSQKCNNTPTIDRSCFELWMEYLNKEV